MIADLFADETLEALPGAEDLPPLDDTEATALIARYNAHKLHAETIKANAAALVKAEERACEGILAVHGERLRLWAASRLPRRGRTVRTLEGTCSFVRQPYRLAVTDERAALAWCRENVPLAVEERVNPKALSTQAYLFTDPITGAEVPAPPPGFAVSGGEERFYIRHGLKADGEGGEE